jgi:hypothetical protein
MIRVFFPAPGGPYTRSDGKSSDSTWKFDHENFQLYTQRKDLSSERGTRGGRKVLYSYQLLQKASLVLVEVQLVQVRWTIPVNPQRLAHGGKREETFTTLEVNAALPAETDAHCSSTNVNQTDMVRRVKVRKEKRTL